MIWEEHTEKGKGEGRQKPHGAREENRVGRGRGKQEGRKKKVKASQALGEPINENLVVVLLKIQPCITLVPDEHRGKNPVLHLKTRAKDTEGKRSLDKLKRVGTRGHWH